MPHFACTSFTFYPTTIRDVEFAISGKYAPRVAYVKVARGCSEGFYSHIATAIGLRVGAGWVKKALTEKSKKEEKKRPTMGRRVVYTHGENFCSKKSTDHDTMFFSRKNNLQVRFAAGFCINWGSIFV